MSDTILSSSVREAIRNEGPFLLSSFIEKVSALKASHQSYDSKKKPRELVSQSWQMANELFYDFYSLRTNAEYRQKEYFDFVIKFFKDILDFKEFSKQSQKIVIDEREFPINYIFDKIPVLIIDPSIDFDKQLLLNFGDQGRKRSANALMQEFLNATGEYLYGIVFNGVKIRILRENPSLTRPAFIEVDLERVFEDQIYSDFTLFYLLFHATRFQAPNKETFNCVFELWRAEAYETGERALDTLKDGVKNALKALGNGFLKHHKNSGLYQDLNAAKLNETEYFQELLVIIYRLLFLLVVEDRDLLINKEASKETKGRYYQGYSVSKLRDLAYKKRNYDSYDDLYQALELVFSKLADGTGAAIGLAGLGGVFKSSKTKFFNGLRLQNSYLLEAIYHIGYFKKEKHTIKINYRDMNTEELGSVYESLLELHPQISIQTGEFFFIGEEPGSEPQAKPTKTKKGSERKTSASYYTHPSLVQEIIKASLEPKIKETIKSNPSNTAKALLELRIIDPACGSGHFLLAAARKLAIEIAQVNAEEYSALGDLENLRLEALHAVIGNCIYGVDKNPLAVELCKCALWIEAALPGKSLNFLDHHIKNGDSLVGVFDLSVLEQGIPDEAFSAIMDDDKDACKWLKKQNRDEREGRSLMSLFDQDTNLKLQGLDEFRNEANTINSMDDSDLKSLELKEKLFAEFEKGESYQNKKLACDLWTSAFFIKKTKYNDPQNYSVPTSSTVKQFLMGKQINKAKLDSARDTSTRYKFFHWPIEFPNIFLNGKQGFDVVLGNPPWERPKLQEQEFFAARRPDIAELSSKERKKQIEGLTSSNRLADQALYKDYISEKYFSDSFSLFMRFAGFNKFTATGDFNLYAVFTELALKLLNSKARAGFVVPSGIAMDSNNQGFFQHLIRDKQLVSLYDFENKEALFRDVHRSYKFCCLTIGNNPGPMQFVFFATNVGHLLIKEKQIELNKEDIELLNPNTKTLPVFRSKKDAELTLKIYRKVPVLINENDPENGNPWGVSFLRMFDMSNDASLFHTQDELQKLESTASPDTGAATWTGADGAKYLPLYEGKMIHHYDHRWSGYAPDGKEGEDYNDAQKADAEFFATPRYWVKESEVESRLKAKGWDKPWLLGFRNVARSTDERTLVAALFPQYPAGNSLQIIFANYLFSFNSLALLSCNLTSMVLDYIARQKIGGVNMNYFYFNQLPILAIDCYLITDSEFIIPRVLELSYTADDMKPLAGELNYFGPPFKWDLDRRAVLKAELDAYYAKLYGLTREELQYILDPSDVMGEEYPTETFRVLKNNETRLYGEYRTKRLVLEAWDRIHSEVKDELAVV
jgi:hypothetical protein